MTLVCLRRVIDLAISKTGIYNCHGVKKKADAIK